MWIFSLDSVFGSKAVLSMLRGWSPQPLNTGNWSAAVLVCKRIWRECLGLCLSACPKSFCQLQSWCSLSTKCLQALGSLCDAAGMCCYSHFSDRCWENLVICWGCCVSLRAGHGICSFAYLPCRTGKAAEFCGSTWLNTASFYAVSTLPKFPSHSLRS